MLGVRRPAVVVATFVLLTGSAGGATHPGDATPSPHLARYHPPGADTKGWSIHATANPNPSAAYTWMDVILETSARRVGRVGARPTIISREMMISTTAMFDAWACYDDKAV